MVEQDDVTEWLRWLIANQLYFVRVGSSPAVVDFCPPLATSVAVPYQINKRAGLSTTIRRTKLQVEVNYDTLED